MLGTIYHELPDAVLVSLRFLPWASYLTSLHLTFFFFTMGLRTSTFRSYAQALSPSSVIRGALIEWSPDRSGGWGLLDVVAAGLRSVAFLRPSTSFFGSCLQPWTFQLFLLGSESLSWSSARVSPRELLSSLMQLLPPTPVGGLHTDWTFLWSFWRKKRAFQIYLNLKRDRSDLQGMPKVAAQTLSLQSPHTPQDGSPSCRQHLSSLCMSCPTLNAPWDRMPILKQRPSIFPLRGLSNFFDKCILLPVHIYNIYDRHRGFPRLWMNELCNILLYTYVI